MFHSINLCITFSFKSNTISFSFSRCLQFFFFFSQDRYGFRFFWEILCGQSKTLFLIKIKYSELIKWPNMISSLHRFCCLLKPTRLLSVCITVDHIFFIFLHNSISSLICVYVGIWNDRHVYIQSTDIFIHSCPTMHVDQVKSSLVSIDNSREGHTIFEHYR